MAVTAMFQSYAQIPERFRTQKVLMMFVSLVELYAQYEDYKRAHPPATEDEIQKLANLKELTRRRNARLASKRFRERIKQGEQLSPQI